MTLDSSVSIPRSEFFRFGHERRTAVLRWSTLVSIPRSEFFRFGLRGSSAICPTVSAVSIPRSEFFRFGHRLLGRPRWSTKSFNSSIGILSVRTRTSPAATASGSVVSIPRSEFFRFGRARRIRDVVRNGGFQFLDRNSFGSDSPLAEGLCDAAGRFNSSIGILSVRTRRQSERRTATERFQFLDRNSFGSDHQARIVTTAVIWCFNSSIGILSVRTPPLPGVLRGSPPGFNSSIGILSVRTKLVRVDAEVILIVSIPRSEFFRFGPARYFNLPEPEAVVSIPRSEFFRFGHLHHQPMGIPNMAVSIPRSEFFRFGRLAHVGVELDLARFNSSIGILSVRTSQTMSGRGSSARVSIPRSEFFRFGRAGDDDGAPALVLVSIPRSEFFRFGHVPRVVERGRRVSFNSSIGILSVRTICDTAAIAADFQFQFLDRNSFGSDAPEASRASSKSAVSIPRSEFFRFGRQRLPLTLNTQRQFQFLDRNSFGSDFHPGHRAVNTTQSFNSSIGILSVRTNTAAPRRPPDPTFQFLDRNSFGSDAPTPEDPIQSRPPFQFLDRNSFGSDMPCSGSRRRGLRVSIPRSEFFRFGRWSQERMRWRSRSFNSSIGILSVRTTAENVCAWSV